MAAGKRAESGWWTRWSSRRRRGGDAKKTAKCAWLADSASLIILLLLGLLPLVGYTRRFVRLL